MLNMSKSILPYAIYFSLLGISINGKALSEEPLESIDFFPVEDAPDCSSFKDDQAVLRAFPFPIAIDPVYDYPGRTYVRVDTNDRIIYMNIIDEKDIPLILFCLTGLKILFIQGSTFRSSHFRLPAAIERLASSLEELHIYDTPTIFLPEQIGRMKVLQTMELHRTGLIHLPESIGALSSLEILSLSENDLSSLPTSMRQMTSLIQLTLNNNPRMSSLESISGHPSLRVVMANDCSIQQIPRNLPKLEALHLSNNALTNLQGIKTLGNATNKKISFYFDSNKIREIPAEIRFVENLDVLNLNDNALFYLTSFLRRLPALTQLHLKKNALSYQEVIELERLIHSSRSDFEIFF